MEILDPKLVAVVATTCAGLYSYMPWAGKHFKRAFAVLLGGFIGLGTVSDYSSIQLVLEGLVGGLLAGFQATFSVALAKYIGEPKKEVIATEEPLHT